MLVVPHQPATGDTGVESRVPNSDWLETHFLANRIAALFYDPRAREVVQWCVAANVVGGMTCAFQGSSAGSGLSASPGSLAAMLAEGSPDHLLVVQTHSSFVHPEDTAVYASLEVHPRPPLSPSLFSEWCGTG